MRIFETRTATEKKKQTNKQTKQKENILCARTVLSSRVFSLAYAYVMLILMLCLCASENQPLFLVKTVKFS